MENNKQIRMMECVFDATTVVYGGSALTKKDWWPQDYDSRDIFQEISKIAKFYEDFYPEDDEDYLENIEMVTTAWFKGNCGEYLTDKDELYLCNNQRVAAYVREHDMSLIDYDCWTTFEEIMGEELTYEEYHKLDAQIDGCSMDYGEDMKDEWLKILEEIRHPKKTYRIQLKEYLSAYRIVELKAASGEKALKTACEKLKAGEFKAAFKDIKLEELDFDDMELLDVTEEE